MAKISNELNSILNENKDPVEESRSPLTFILLLIFAVIAVYFAVMYFNIKEAGIRCIRNKYNWEMEQAMVFKVYRKAFN